MPINTTTQEGNLTADTHRTDNGTLMFTIAQNDGYFGKDEKWVDEPNFFKCQVPKSKESLQKRIQERAGKGSEVVVHGKLNTWAADGEGFHDCLSIIVQKVVFGERCKPRPKKADTRSPNNKVNGQDAPPPFEGNFVWAGPVIADPYEEDGVLQVGIETRGGTRLLKLARDHKLVADAQALAEEDQVKVEFVEGKPESIEVTYRHGG